MLAKADINRMLVPILFDALGVLLSIDSHSPMGAMKIFYESDGPSVIQNWIDGP